MKQLSPWLAFLAGCATTVAFVALLPHLRSQGQDSGPKQGFVLRDAQFSPRPTAEPTTPKIPGGWRLVSVSHAAADHEDHLWFQDAAGNVYVVRSRRTDLDHLIVDETFLRLPSANGQ